MYQKGFCSVNQLQKLGGVSRRRKTIPPIIKNWSHLYRFRFWAWAAAAVASHFHKPATCVLIRSGSRVTDLSYVRERERAPGSHPKRVETTPGCPRTHADESVTHYSSLSLFFTVHFRRETTIYDYYFYYCCPKPTPISLPPPPLLSNPAAVKKKVPTTDSPLL
jgi:hypothetical protein